MTLRFEEGDRVLLKTLEGWITSSVDLIWVIGDISSEVTANSIVPHYKYGPYVVQTDSDLVIMKHSTSL